MFIKYGLQHQCFPKNFVKLLRSTTVKPVPRTISIRQPLV